MKKTMARKTTNMAQGMMTRWRTKKAAHSHDPAVACMLINV